MANKANDVLNTLLKLFWAKYPPGEGWGIETKPIGDTPATAEARVVRRGQIVITALYQSEISLMDAEDEATIRVLNKLLLPE